ncbi:glycine cleavage system protein GcvH [bacterium]|nr:MAG: glycine cleavage system protein GcvH [bacterium]
MPQPEKCRYTKSHEWIVVEGGEALVGISDHAQHEISDVVFVDLPKAGRAVTQGEGAAVVESVKAAFDIYAPAAGTVSAVNPALAGDPALLNRDPHGEGWLFKLTGVDLKQVDALMTLAQYQDFLKTAH